MASDLPNSAHHYKKIPFNLDPHDHHKPDLIYYREGVDGRPNEIVIVELTVPLTRNVDKQHDYKQSKYTDWSLSFPDSVKSTIIAFEVASETGFVSKSLTELFDFFNLSKKGQLRKTIMLDLAVEAVRASGKIMRSRNNRHFSTD